MIHFTACHRAVTFGKDGDNTGSGKKQSLRTVPKALPAVVVIGGHEMPIVASGGQVYTDMEGRESPNQGSRAHFSANA